MCTMWIDGLNGIVRHVSEHADFVVVGQAPVEQLRAWARRRGWHNLRLLSSAPSSFKTDLGMQSEDGTQHPGLSVFTRLEDGSLRHFYTGSAHLADDIPEGGMDQCSVVWNLLDLLPEGRGEWYPSLVHSHA